MAFRVQGRCALHRDITADDASNIAQHGLDRGAKRAFPVAGEDVSQPRRCDRCGCGPACVEEEDACEPVVAAPADLIYRHGIPNDSDICASKNKAVPVPQAVGHPGDGERNADRERANGDGTGSRG